MCVHVQLGLWLCTYMNMQCLLHFFSLQNCLNQKTNKQKNSIFNICEDLNICYKWDKQPNLDTKLKQISYFPIFLASATYMMYFFFLDFYSTSKMQVQFDYVILNAYLSKAFTLSTEVYIMLVLVVVHVCVFA